MIASLCLTAYLTPDKYLPKLHHGANVVHQLFSEQIPNFIIIYQLMIGRRSLFNQDFHRLQIWLRCVIGVLFVGLLLLALLDDYTRFNEEVFIFAVNQATFLFSVGLFAVVLANVRKKSNLDQKFRQLCRSCWMYYAGCALQIAFQLGCFFSVHRLLRQWFYWIFRDCYQAADLAANFFVFTYPRVAENAL